MYNYFNSLFCFGIWVVLVGVGIALGGGGVVMEFDILVGSVLNMSIPLMMDVFSVVFSLVVITISSCVMFYNGFYMDSEVFYNRFCKLVLLFVISMLFLVMIPNFLGLMVGWDGLGLTSYLLVIYYQDKRSLGSGTITVLTNRIGDVLFFVAISFMSGVSSWSFTDLEMSGIISFLCGVVVVGCMTKSAQVPFSAWLPAAMAAPSPVSALVHSSTLVTAGVYVLVRFSGCMVGGWYIFLGLVSSLTMLMSAVSAVFEPDVKKVVALSTLSQLGVMMLAISVGAVSVCFFHLVSHALFKALMFLCVGSVIHFSGIQDLRYLGGFMYSSPIVVGWLVVACLSLSGFPFLAGFYSKDLVLEAFLSGGINYLLCVMVVVSTCLTSLYSGWMVYSVLFGSMSLGYVGGMVSGVYVIIPCSVLGLGALFGGVVLQSLVVNFNMVFDLSSVLKVVPSFCLVGGVGALIFFVVSQIGGSFRTENHSNSKVEVVSDLSAKMWFMPSLSSDFFSSEALGLSGSIKSNVEDGYLEFSIGSDGIWDNSKGLSSYYVNCQVEVIGIYFVKGVVFVCLTLMVFMLLGV